MTKSPNRINIIPMMLTPFFDGEYFGSKPLYTIGGFVFNNFLKKRLFQEFLISAWKFPYPPAPDLNRF